MVDSIASLIQAVEDADTSQRLLIAVKNLSMARREEAIPTLMATLSYNNPGAAVAAVDGLIQLGELAVPALLELLDLHNYTARAWAIRALAGIGDPRGLAVLLEAATTDFALSVRRAATRGLGLMKWHWCPNDGLEIVQEQVLTALLQVAQQDEEWVVRYAAIFGLQALVSRISKMPTTWRSQILNQFEQMAVNDVSLAVRARVWMAQEYLQTERVVQLPKTEDVPSPLSEEDWQRILEQLDARKQNCSTSATNDGSDRDFAASDTIA